MYSIKQRTIVWRSGVGPFLVEPALQVDPREMTVGRGEDREIMADLFLRLSKTCMEDEMLELFDEADWELLASYSPNGAFTE